MADALKKLDELHGVLVLAKAAQAKGQIEGLARVIEEMHIQTGILLHALRNPMRSSATIYDLAAEHRARG